MLPVVSVIVLNYNGLRHLKECFSSLCQTNYPRHLLDLIFIDNGSADESINFIKKNFPLVNIVDNGANLGWAGGNNAGIPYVKGDYLVFINNDVRVDKNWLLPLLAPFKSNKVGCVSSKILLYNDTKTIGSVGCFFTFLGITGSIGRGSPSSKFSDFTKFFSPTGTCCIMEKDYFIKIGMFDSDFFLYCEDYDMGWRILNDGKFNVLSPKSLIYHNEHSGGLTLESSPGKKLYYYYHSRNRIFTIIKNAPSSMLFGLIILSFFATIVQGLLFIKHGHHALAQSTYRGLFDALFGKDSLKWWRKRRGVLKTFHFLNYTLGLRATIKLLTSKKKEHLDS